MKYRSSTETSLKILTLLAIEKEYAQYDMPKKVRKDYRTTLRHLQDLEKHGLILLSRTEPASKGGKDRKIYTLTKAGLIVILGYEHIYDSIDQVATNYATDFPLIFGKWQFFIENDCGDVAVQRLKDTMRLAYKYIGVNLPRLLSQEYLERLEKVKPEAEKVGFETLDAIDDIIKHFLLFPVVTSFSMPWAFFPEDLEKPHHAIGKKWMDMLKRDAQLRTYVEKKLVIAHKHAKRDLEARASFLDYWKK
jgi:DNA-binding PadR family transcriptional regulator